MEDTGTNPSLVHVLRHSFRPNEPLRMALSHLLPTGPDGSRFSSREFLLFGSDERVIDVLDAQRPTFLFEQSEANKLVERYAKRPLPLQPEIEARVLQSKARGMVAMQLIFNVSDAEKYAPLLDTLDDFTFGERRLALGFSATRVYLNMPFTQLKPIPELKESLRDINKASQTLSSNRAYQVFANNRLSGEFLPR